MTLTDAGRWVELRVHGVSGTPPEELLESDRVIQVGGSSRSQFFQRASAGGDHEPAGRTLEAFQWSKYTSGSKRNVCWLVLLPFGIVNAAQFMLHRPRSFAGFGDRAGYAVASALLRLLGFTLTLLLIFGVCVIALDLIAWQALGKGGAGRWLMPAALAPVALLAFLIWLGSPALAEPATQPDFAASDPGDRPRSDFAEPGFYSGSIRSPDLWLLHVAGSLALVWSILSGLQPLTLDFGEHVVAAAAGLIMVLGDPEGSASVVKTATPRRITWFWRRVVLRTVVRALAGLSVVGFGSAVLDVGSRLPVARTVRTMPGIDRAALVLLTGTVVVLVLFCAACAVVGLRARAARRSVPSAFAPYLGGNAAAVAAGVATFLGVGLTASVILLARLSVNALTGRRVDVPQIVERAAYAWGLTILLMIAVLVVIVVVARVQRSSYVARAMAMYTPVSQPLSAGRARVVAAALFRARLKYVVMPILAVFTVIGVLLSVAAWLEMARFTWRDGLPGAWADTFEPCNPERARCAPSDALRWLSGWDAPGAAGVIMWIGVVALLALAVGLVALALLSSVSPLWLRGWVIIWDVLSFWPRSAHPGVPPPYSLRVVRDLALRVQWHLHSVLEQDGRRIPPASAVVLGGHSQGSLISFAALLRLAPTDRERVGFVSFGSQLQVAFARAFPAYVNEEAITWLYERMDRRWVNLYRETDPLGGPVLSWWRSPDGDQPSSRRIDDPTRDQADEYVDGVRRSGCDWRLLDPPPDQLTGPVWQLRGHADYVLDRTWVTAVGSVRPGPGNPPVRRPDEGLATERMNRRGST